MLRYHADRRFALTSMEAYNFARQGSPMQDLHNPMKATNFSMLGAIDMLARPSGRRPSILPATSSAM
jgi:hypothetical protein